MGLSGAGDRSSPVTEVGKTRLGTGCSKGPHTHGPHGTRSRCPHRGLVHASREGGGLPRHSPMETSVAGPLRELEAPPSPGSSAASLIFQARGGGTGPGRLSTLRAHPAALPWPTAGDSLPRHAAPRVLGSRVPPAPAPSPSCCCTGEAPLHLTDAPGHQPGWCVAPPGPRRSCADTEKLKPGLGAGATPGARSQPHQTAHKGPQARVSYCAGPMRWPLPWAGHG